MTNWTDFDIQLPTTSGNSGSLVHHVQKNLAVGLVAEPLVVLARNQIVKGVYAASTGQLAVVNTAQNGTTTGWVWITNPTADTTRACRIRRIWGTSQMTGVVVCITAPRVKFASMTFTGTPSGAALTPMKMDSTYPSANLTLNTAVTGLTPTVGTQIGASALLGLCTAVGVYVPSDVEVLGPFGNEDEYFTLRPGEGAVIYQDTGGTASDTRLVNLNFLWDEIDIS